MNDTVEITRKTQNQATEYRVTEGDIGAASGNYIFTVGDVSCGKTTLQNILIYRLWTNESIIFEYAHSRGDHRHNALLNDWVTSFAQGEFPERTNKGLLQEFNVSFGQSKRKPVKMNYLEISGEDIKSIVPGLTTQKPALNSQLNQYLKLDKINKRFIFVSDCELHASGQSNQAGLAEDILFNELLEYLASPHGIGLKRINILFVAAKWDLVKDQYHGGAEEYFRRHFPQTRAFAKRPGIHAAYIPFTIGTVDLQEEEGGRMTQRIKSLENRYVDLMIQWIYNSYTGHSLLGFPKIVPTYLDRLKSFVARFGRQGR